MSLKKYCVGIGCFFIIHLFFNSSFAQSVPGKEFSQEVSAQKGSVIRVVGNSAKLFIKAWDQPKVKVSVQLAGDSSGRGKTNEELFESLGITIKPFSNRVDISTRTAFVGKVQGKSITMPDLKPVTSEPNLKYKMANVFPSDPSRDLIPQVMTIMVPTNSKLDLENRFGDVTISMDLDDAKLEINNGTLDAQNIKELNLVSNFCNVNLGNVGNGEVEFYNGTFRAQNVKHLDLDSRASNIEYEKGDYLYLRSQTDEINIHEIVKIEGRKLYGSIKIDQLNGSFDLEGANTDIKFRNILPEASLIKINNKYGDVRLPVKSLKNYFVDFTGYYSTVFAPFEKQVVKEDSTKFVSTSDQDQIAKAMGDRFSKGQGAFIGELAPRRFTSTVGDNRGKHTRIELICNSCTVDFK